MSNATDQIPKPRKTRVFGKKDMQQVLRDCRKGGYTVTKINSGYTIHLDDVLLLKAMNGSMGYLTTFTCELLAEVA